MSILILGMVLFIIGTYLMGLFVQSSDDMGITFLFTGLLLAGFCAITTYIVTECHQDIIDKAGYELDLREESKAVEK